MLELVVEACDTLVLFIMLFFLGEAPFKSLTDTLAFIASSTTDEFSFLPILAEPPLSLFALPLTKLLLLTIAIGCCCSPLPACCFLISFLSFSIYSVASKALLPSSPLCVFEDTISFLRINPPFLTVVLLIALASSASMSLTTELNYWPVAADGENVPLARSLNIPSRIRGIP